MSLKLSFAQANAICRNWIPIADNFLEYSDQMSEAGFSAFLPRREFVESFGQSSEEIALHRRCLAEFAKQRLCRPNLPIFDEDLKEIYFSPLLQDLMRKRDLENGCSENELSRHFTMAEAAWRREIDPCQRRLVQDSVEHRLEHVARFQDMLDRERMSAEKEAKIHASEFARADRYIVDHKERYAFFGAIMDRDSDALGFRRDKQGSRSGRPVFSKEIARDWKVYWIVDDPRMFHAGHCAPGVYLRNAGAKKAKIEPGQILSIGYKNLVDGSLVSYWAYSDFCQLERVIKAHLFLYGLVASKIEEGIRQVLG